MRISGLAAAITRDLRTKRTRAFEEVTLKSIASQIADEQSLTLFGDVPNISFQRKTQNDETDLEFLNRLAEDYSLAFTVRDRTLIFHDIDTLERTNPLFTLERKNLKRYSLKEKSRNIFKAAEIQYLNPQEGQYLTHRYEVPGIQNGDTLMIKERVENLSQAEFRTIGALKEANRNLNRGSLTIPGNPMALSGVIFKLDDFGQISGNYLIEKAHHLSRRSSGYETKLDVRRVD
jgi:phage protein D